MRDGRGAADQTDPEARSGTSDAPTGGPARSGVRGAALLGLGVAALVAVGLAVAGPGGTGGGDADREVDLGAVADDVDLAAIDADIACGRPDGCVRWAVPLDVPFDGRVHLEIDGDVAVVTAPDRGVWAFDVGSGEPLWATDEVTTSATEPGVHLTDGLVLATRGEGRVLDAATGEEVVDLDVDGIVVDAARDGDLLRLAWTEPPADGPPDDVPDAAEPEQPEDDAALEDASDEDPTSDGPPVAVAPEGGAGVLDLADGTWRWRSDEPALAVTPSFVRGDPEGRIAVLDPDDGRERWAAEAAAPGLVFVDDVLAFQESDDEVVLRRLADGERVGRVPGALQARVDAPPVLVTHEGTVRAYDADGELRWETEPPEVPADPARWRLREFTDDLLHIAQDGDPRETSGTLLDRGTGEVAGSVPDELGLVAAVVAASEETLVTRSPGEVTALHRARGHVVFRAVDRAGWVPADAGDEPEVVVLVHDERVVAVEVP